MKLATLLSYTNSNFSVPLSLENITVTAIEQDSRCVQPGALFLALPGTQQHGRIFIQAAIERGAVAVLVDVDACEPVSCCVTIDQPVPIIAFPNLKAQLGKLLTGFYQAQVSSASQLDLVAVTGTNGKTSVAYLMAQLSELLGIPAGMIGTLGAGRLSTLQDTGLTTPNCCALHQQIAALQQQGVKTLIFEASSHALSQDRLAGVQPKIGIFTNLSQDHLDYHPSMQAYFQAKAQLFLQHQPRYAVINLKDPYGQQLLKQLPEAVIAYGYAVCHSAADRRALADYQIPMIILQGEQVTTPWGQGRLQSNLIGEYNQENSLACLTALVLLGHTLENVLAQFIKVQAAPGRLQRVGEPDPNLPDVIVDYAHTPDALQKVLQTLQKMTYQRICCVFGCGGDRDRSKRPLMLQVACQYSDSVIVTQDNPRTESPQQIVDDMNLAAGRDTCHNISVELDRYQAIVKAVKQAKPADVILIAGKGHETVQLINNQKQYFSDVESAERILQNMKEELCTP